MRNQDVPEGAERRLMKILAAGLPRSARSLALSPERNLRDLGLNSLGLILVVTKFCEECGVGLDVLDVEVGPLRTVGDLLAEGRRILEAQGRQGRP